MGGSSGGSSDLVTVVLLLGVGYWLLEKGGLEQLEKMLGEIGNNTGAKESAESAPAEGGGGGEETPPAEGEGDKKGGKKGKEEEPAAEGGETPPAEEPPAEEKKGKKGGKKKVKKEEKANYANAFFSNRYYNPSSMRSFRGRMSYG
jgi:hypothetical protein